jgi:hypothetical protein
VPSFNLDGSLAGKTTLTDPLGGEYYTNDVAGTTATRPYGLGPRVPMYVISPWSRGGWVRSEVFDHTSTIRFLEASARCASAPDAGPRSALRACAAVCAALTRGRSCTATSWK